MARPVKSRESAEPLEPTKLSALLRARRDALHLSRMDVYKRTGISDGTLDSYERGRMPRLDVALQLARLYGISYSDLAEAIGMPSVPSADSITPAQAITAARLRRGWTIDQMASELGATAHEIAAYERGSLEVTAGLLARVMALPGLPSHDGDGSL